MSNSEVLVEILKQIAEDANDQASWNSLCDLLQDMGWELYGIAPINTIAKAMMAKMAMGIVAPTREGQERITLVDFHVHGYAEPGYSNPKCGIIAVGNWNSVTGPWANRGPGNEILDDSPEKLSAILEGLGISLEWCDEWTSCSECNSLVRTQPDSYDWEQSYDQVDFEILCRSCMGE